MNPGYVAKFWNAAYAIGLRAHRVPLLRQRRLPAHAEDQLLDDVPKIRHIPGT
jgi:hypothetical protein